MTHAYSIPVDTLIQARLEAGPPPTDGPANGAVEALVIATADVVIVGSGYGASVAAMKLAGLEKADGTPISVVVLERGREYAVGEFPGSASELPGHVRMRRPSDPHPTGNPDALFDFRIGEDLDLLVANGLGGGSLINANVAAIPDAAVFDEKWPAKYRNGGLDHAFGEIKRLLGASAEPGKSRKYLSLEHLALKLERTSAKADITVTQGTKHEKRLNKVELWQPTCLDCGDCITGCNVGAKNTLMMNLIPLAHERGARFVTGANVLSVAKPPSLTAGPPNVEPRWRVTLQCTHSIRTPLETERYFVDARYVILAAGAVGSTEILLRSKPPAGSLSLSGEVGKRFSTNGDGLGFSFGQTVPVEAIGTHDILSGNGPGPTITGIIKGKLTTEDGVEQPFSLEEGAVPASLVKIFGEALITGAELNRIGDNELPGWFDAQPHDHDPLAYNREILDYGQVFLMMSDDRSLRSLEFPAADGLLDWGQRSVFPPQLDDEDEARAANAGLVALDEMLVEQDRKSGFDKGQYVANPLWRLLPKDASRVLSGKLPRGRNLSVHPLGGCCMGADSATAVVNADGVVFDSNGGLHDGLYVMDGAVLPRALATNPFLTISAVAWTCCDALIEGPFAQENWTDPGNRPDVVSGNREIDSVGHGQPEPRSALLILREQMLGSLAPDTLDPDEVQLLDSLVEGGARFLGRHGMILRIETEGLDVHTRFASLANGPVVIDAKAELFRNPESAEFSTKRRRYGAPVGLSQADIVAEGSAKITILELDAPGFLEKLVRGARALGAYGKRRGSTSEFWKGNLWELIGDLIGFLSVAEMHANYRQFDYRFELTSTLGADIEFGGTKKIRWANDNPRMWDSLLNLPVDKVEFSKGEDRVDAPAHFEIDVGYLLDEGLIQIAESDDMVESAMTAFSFLGWFARCLIQTGFWEFGAPVYPKKGEDTTPALDPQELKTISSSNVAPVIHPLPVESVKGGPLLDLELVRYPQDGPGDPGKGPVLLIHGLAQGSGVYSSPRMQNNMAAYFWNQGYDVWLLDHRLSNRFDEARVPYGEWAIDAIGEFDIPAAVKKVHETSGRTVKIFAHCVGAIATQMAILKGRLKDDQGENRIESVCFNAIHPWIVPAAANIARSKLGAFAETWISKDLLDPIPRYDEDATRSLFDRIGFSLARIGEGTVLGGEGHGKGDEFYQGICDRMTFLYGRMWQHENIEQELKENWLDIVGRAPAQVYLQLYYLLEREQILNDDGKNEYVTDENLLQHWSSIPTFFIHGERSNVFNPQSATRSAFRLNKLLRTIEGDSPVHNLAPVYLHRIPEYGHMDPILAKNAHRHVYPKLERFFEHAARWHDDGTKTGDFDEIREQDDPSWSPVIEPETGHAVRAAWIDGDRVAIRYWYERFAYNTTPAIKAAIRVNSEKRRVYLNEDLITLSEPMYVWLDDRPNPAEFEPPKIVDVVRDRSTLSVMAHKSFFDHPAEAEGALLELLDQVIPLLSPEPEAPLVALASVVSPSGLPSGSGPDENGAEAGAGAGADLGTAGYEVVGVDLDVETSVEVTDKQPPWYRRLIEKILQEDGANDRFSFFVSSCRYPGTPVESDLSDGIFSGMLARSREADLDMSFFIGDQIYADAYNTLFDNSAWEDGYLRSYRSAFTSPKMATFLQSMPIHFAIDDHEIVDDWSGGGSAQQASRLRSPLGPQALTYGGITQDQVEFATKTARSYMSSARERAAVGAAEKPQADSLWYALDHDNEVNFPCFVLDTRTERELRTAEKHRQVADYPKMMNDDQAANASDDGQLTKFKKWLTQLNAPATRDRPKFVFAGQVMAPISKQLIAHPALFRAEEGFVGYPRTLRAIIEHIVENDIENVIFVGGDLHMSCAAELTLTANGKSITAWQIVSSGLYSPMAFANARPSDYDWSAPQVMKVLPGSEGVTLGYAGEWLTDRHSHFLQVDVAAAPNGSSIAWVVSVSVFGADGKQIEPANPFKRKGGNLQVEFAELDDS